MLMRWTDPFREIQTLQKEMSRVFQDVLPGLSTPLRNEESFSGVWAPPVDIAETADRLVFKIELPGFKQEELSLNIEAGVLTLRGERKFEKKTDDKNYHRVERSYGQFVRSFALPANFDSSRVKADLDEGVLTIELPKREESQPKSIPIGSSKVLTGEKTGG